MTEVLFGRRAELSKLGRFIEPAGGGFEALFISGEAGVGKTCLWQEALSIARRAGREVLHCQAARSEARMSFSALTDLTQPIIEESLPALPSPQRTALSAALLREEASSPIDQRTVGTAMLNLLRHLAASRSILVAIDDLQWLDEPSTRALSFALRRLNGNDPVRLVATQRVTGDHSEVGLIAEHLAGRLQWLDLAPLEIPALIDLLRTRLEPRLPRPTLLEIARISAGNPFLAMELGRAMIHHGKPLDPGERLPVPGTLEELVRERVVSLPAKTREMLLTMAAMPSPDLTALRKAFGDEAYQAVEPAVEGGVLERDRNGVRFQHPLFASAVYSVATPAHRRAAHRRLADLATDPEETARHLALATVGPNEEVASELNRAAEKAHSRGAVAAAAELAEWAAQRTPGPDVDARVQRMIDAGRHWFEAGDLGRGAALLEAAAQAAPIGDLRAQALLRLGETRYNQGDFPAAAQILGEALENAQSATTRALVLQTLSISELNGGDPASALRRAEEALSLVEADRDRRAYACVLTTWIGLAFLFGREVKEEQLHEAMELDELTWHLPFERRPGLIVPTTLKWMDRADEAREMFAAQEQLLIGRGEDVSLPLLYYSWSELEVWAGRHDRAKDLADRAYRMSAEHGLETMRCFSLHPAGLLAAIAGDVERARAMAEEGSSMAVKSGATMTLMLHAGVQAFLDLSLGHPAAAHQRLQPVVQIMSAIGMADGAALRVVPDDIEALISLGEYDPAIELLDPFEQYASAVDRIWARAAAARCRALLASAHGNLEEALQHCAAALEQHARIDQPLDLGRTLLVKGTVERRAKQKGAARQSLEQALGTFERLGAALWAARARDELRRIGGRVAKPWDLTPTEQKVGVLAAAGHTNKEIAEALFLSIRTVEGSLSRAYHKLGVRSRTDLVGKLPPARSPTDGAETGREA